MHRLPGKDLLLLAIGFLLGGGIGLLVLFGIDNHFISDVRSLFSLETQTGVGEYAPDFKLTNLEHKSENLSDYLGKPILINFWATWCTPCRYEMPLFEQYARKYDSQLVILAVNLQQTDTEVTDYVNELGITFPILLDLDGSISQMYRVQGLPTSYFINSEGRINDIHIGSITEQQLSDYLERIGISND